MMKLRCAARDLLWDEKGSARYNRTAEGDFVLCGEPVVAIIQGETRCAKHLFHGPRMAGKSVFLDE